MLRRLLAASRKIIVNVLAPALAGWLLAAGLYREIHPPPSSARIDGSGFGTVTLRLKLPGTAGGIAEPLVVCGVPGKATLVYIRLMTRARAKVGVEFWGIGAYESDVFKLPAANAEIRVTCTVPAFFPPEGDRHWRSASRDAQRAHRLSYSVAVDGVSRLTGEIRYEQPIHPRIYLGTNPIGGSVVSQQFTGKILDATQTF